jgi:hypothetical protein
MVDGDATVVCSKPCRGLNAGSFAGYDFVCNPATGYYKVIRLGLGGAGTDVPRTAVLQNDIARRLAAKHMEEEEEDVFTAGRLGFGYHEEANRHAMVRITYTERNMETRAYGLECKFRYVVDMYWEEIAPPPRPVADTPPAHLNGKLYWMVDTRLGQTPRQEIVVLDLSTRKFEVVHGPPCVSNNSSILELQEAVCVANCIHSTNAIEIWADEATGSWSLKYRIELGRFSPEYSTYQTTPLAVDPVDGKILLTTGRALGYYNPRTN